MKKIIPAFIGSSLIKGWTLFIMILVGDFFPSSLSLLGILIFFILISVIDWISLSWIKKELGDLKFWKVLTFCYLNLVGLLWVTGPTFLVYNSLMNIEYEGEPEMPQAAVWAFLIISLLVTIGSCLIWIKKHKK